MLSVDEVEISLRPMISKALGDGGRIQMIFHVRKDPQ